MSERFPRVLRPGWRLLTDGDHGQVGGVTPRRSGAGAVVNVEPTAFQLAQRHCRALLLDPLSPVLPWATVPEGIYDPADRPIFIVRIIKPETIEPSPMQKIIDLINRGQPKRLSPPFHPPETD